MFGNRGNGFGVMNYLIILCIDRPLNRIARIKNDYVNGSMCLRIASSNPAERVEQ